MLSDAPADENDVEPRPVQEPRARLRRVRHDGEIRVVRQRRGDRDVGRPGVQQNDLLWPDDRRSGDGETGLAVHGFVHADRGAFGGRRDQQGAAVDAFAMTLIGQLAQVTAHRVFGCLEFSREFGCQDAALRSQPFQNQLFPFLGQKPVHCVLSCSLHDFTLLDCETIIIEQNYRKRAVDATAAKR